MIAGAADVLSVLVPYVLSCANGHKNRNNWNWKSSCTNVRLQKAFRKTNQWKGENSIRWGGGWEILPLHLYVNLIEYTASGCLFGYLRLQYFQSFATKTHGPPQKHNSYENIRQILFYKVLLLKWYKLSNRNQNQINESARQLISIHAFVKSFIWVQCFVIRIGWKSTFFYKRIPLEMCKQAKSA